MASYFMLRILRSKRSVSSKMKNEGEDNKSDGRLPDLDDHKCRICLKPGTKPIYGNDSTTELSEAIHMCGGIDISENDEFPKHLCAFCYSLLQNAILFKKQAQESDKLLRNFLIKNADSPSCNEVEFDGGFSENGSLLNFKSNIDQNKNYRCKICKVNYNNWEEYLTHKSSKAHKNVRIKCPKCHRLLTVGLYKKHLARHQTSHHICNVCGKLFRKDNLMRHLQLHNSDLPFQCQLCPYRGRFMESLRVHMRTHTGEKPFACQVCHLRFLTKSNLNRHLFVHKKEKPYKCKECGRGFYIKRDMDAHFNSDHVGIKLFGCRLCGSKYGTRKALMKHELRVHKRDKMPKGRMPLYLQAEYRK